MSFLTPVRVVSDQPAVRSAAFGFEGYARTIAGIVADRNNETPLVIGIYGSWGSGKTTLMESVKALLDTGVTGESDALRTCKTVWFPAWKYGRGDEILAGLAEVVFKTMKADGFLEASRARIEELVQKLSPSKVVSRLSKLATRHDVTELFAGMDYRKKLGFYEGFHEFFDRLIWDYLQWRPKLNRLEQPDDADGVLVIFIDDLDRCPRDRVLQVLETIKLFLDKPNCVFVIGADHDILVKALEKPYGDDAIRFMDKIVQVNFNLPSIPPAAFEGFLAEKLPEWTERLSPHLPLLVPALGGNPRRFKRFVNNLGLMEEIRRTSGVELPAEKLVYWTMIEDVSPVLREHIVAHRPVLDDLREWRNQLYGEDGQGEIAPGDDRWETVPPNLREILRNRALANLAASFQISEAELNFLITLTGMVKSAEERAARTPVSLQSDDQGIRVEPGEFVFGRNGETEWIENAYVIDLYPVTNERFREFMADGGYETESLWSPEGWAWRRREEIVRPKFWEDPDWNGDLLPVVGVSAHEAEAFARWDGKRLPTEAEWERAAAGRNGRRYPWGESFEENRCNTAEAGLGIVTSVKRFSRGLSPAGCYDMVGNVWEWTADSWQDAARVLKGGCWKSEGRSLSCATRDVKPSFRRNRTIGFRCVRG
jgi:formylglycine-generating enzyme required for sulfatase activity